MVIKHMSTNINYTSDKRRGPAVGERVIPAPTKKRATAQASSKNMSVRAAAREKRMKMERYQAQESKRAIKIQVDQNVVLITWIVGIAIAFLASAIVSFNGITSVAVFVGLSQAWMASLFFFFVELMYLLFLVAYLVLASRIDEDGKAEFTGGALWGMITFGGIAVLANAFHTFDYWGWTWPEPQMWAGVVLSVSAPIAIIAASKMSSRIVFARAVRLD
jgi:hypothetical protein